jgi:hypothetical protein
MYRKTRESQLISVENKKYAMHKYEADNCKKIEIWWLLRDIKQRYGYKKTTISWGENGSRGSISVEVSVRDKEKYVRFLYIQIDNKTGEEQSFKHRFPLIETACHIGGTRYWFECSLYTNDVYCGRRTGVLYKCGDWFGCRHCHNLTYRSRNVNKRYANYGMFRVFDLGAKIEKLERQTKRYTYKRKLTKKWKRIEKLQEELLRYYGTF